MSASSDAPVKRPPGGDGRPRKQHPALTQPPLPTLRERGSKVGRQLLRRAGVTRSRAAAARICCERLGRSAVYRAAGTPQSRILCYHSVGTPAWGVNDVSPVRFRRQLELALEEGWGFVPARDIALGTAPAKSLAVTFDDGLASVVANAAPILRELRIPWSYFVVSGWSDGHHRFGDGVIAGWREVEAALAAGAEVGSHSVTHPNFASLTREQAEDELARSREVIGARVGPLPEAFAIPFGQSGDWPAAAGAAALSTGYTTVYAQSVTRRPPGTVARTFVTRFDGDRVFRAALDGAFDRWEEWR